MIAKKLRHLAEYIGARLVIFVIRVVPRKAGLFLGNILGILAFSVVRMRRKVTMKNLRASLGTEYSAKQLVKIGRDSYRNFGRSLVDFFTYDQLSIKQLDQMYTFRDAGVFDEALRLGKGAILLSAHFGSWELVGAYVTRKGYPIEFVVGEQHNPYVNDWINRQREKSGSRMINAAHADRALIRALRGGRFVAMVADQDAGPDGVILDFFGRPASFARGPALMAVKFGCPMIFGLSARTGGDRHEFILAGLFSAMEGLDREEQITAIVSEYSRGLERFIREYPEQWFWAHRRWKSTCGGY